MSTATPQVRSLYRRILRELPSRPTPSTTSTPQSRTPDSSQFRSTCHAKLSAPTPLQTRVRESFVAPRSSDIRSQMQQAEQFIQYVQAQRMYTTLIERYNPGMGMSEEERVRLSARRVGMNLPVEFEAGGGEK
ncbi:hypothetical protein BDV95DRAFT_604511 [Massariosphaeria phaeospora]|uniref:Ras guanyl-nucleotide exchange factor RasGEF n=1 Tax=Massariosphaeria phaeospora TaxID=100035 RepID=A0A7C8MT64_9PLEO|nr:hypothetical protein BDV95DRAFT_604511 [Massariosphaeria phaeospora]